MNYNVLIQNRKSVREFADKAADKGIIVVLRLWNGGSKNRNDDVIAFFQEHLDGDWSKNTKGITIRKNLYAATKPNSSFGILFWIKFNNFHGIKSNNSEPRNEMFFFHRMIHAYKKFIFYIFHTNFVIVRKFFIFGSFNGCFIFNFMSRQLNSTTTN